MSSQQLYNRMLQELRAAERDASLRFKGHTQKRRSGTIPFPFQEPFMNSIESKPGAESHQEEKFQQIT
jgi:hypothetical protein